MNNERLALLLKYMDGLTTMMANDYRCVSEIDECVKWIREEFTKPSVSKDPFESLNSGG